MEKILRGTIRSRLGPTPLFRRYLRSRNIKQQKHVALKGIQPKKAETVHIKNLELKKIKKIKKGLLAGRAIRNFNFLGF
jgi:hypothetical protein